TCTGASLLANPLRSTHALGEDPLCRREQPAATPARPCLWAYLLDLGPAALRCLLAGSRFAEPSIAPVSHRIWPFPSLSWRPYAARPSIRPSPFEIPSRPVPFRVQALSTSLR